MNLNIGLNTNLSQIVLRDISRIETTNFKIGLKRKKNNLISQPEILEALIISLGSSAAWDLLKAVFNILKTNNIKMNPINTDLGKIGSIYFGDSASNITVIIQSDNSALISNNKKPNKLKINKNFEIIEGD